MSPPLPPAAWAAACWAACSRPSTGGTPSSAPPPGRGPDKGRSGGEGFLTLLTHAELRRIFLVAFGGFFVFSSVFNYLPFYLSGAPFHAPTHLITLLYLSFLLG